MQRSLSNGGLVSPLQTAAGQSLNMQGLSAYGGSGGSPLGASMLTQDSRAANFVPKLLNKLAALEEKVNMLIQEKVDVDAYERSRELAATREQAMADDIRQLKADVAILSATTTEHTATLAAKADSSALDRERRQLQELTSVVQGKVDLVVFREMHSAVTVLEAGMDQAQREIEMKASMAMMSQEQDKIDQVIAVLHNKVDNEEFMKLQSEVSALESNVEEFGRIAAQKADGSVLDRLKQNLKETNAILASKADGEALKKLESESLVMEASVTQMTQTVEKGVSVEDYEALYEDVRQLFLAMQEKADAATVNRMDADLSTAGATLNEVKRVVEAHHQTQAEDRERMMQLHQSTSQLQNLSHILIQTKADADSVPHLHQDVLDQL